MPKTEKGVVTMDGKQQERLLVNSDLAKKNLLKKRAHYKDKLTEERRAEVFKLFGTLSVVELVYFLYHVFDTGSCLPIPNGMLWTAFVFVVLMVLMLLFHIPFEIERKKADLEVASSFLTAKEGFREFIAVREVSGFNPDGSWNDETLKNAIFIYLPSNEIDLLVSNYECGEGVIQTGAAALVRFEEGWLLHCAEFSALGALFFMENR